jgi:hypothetical protein
MHHRRTSHIIFKVIVRIGRNWPSCGKHERMRTSGRYGGTIYSFAISISGKRVPMERGRAVCELVKFTKNMKVIRVI